MKALSCLSGHGRQKTVVVATTFCMLVCLSMLSISFRLMEAGNISSLFYCGGSESTATDLGASGTTAIAKKPANSPIHDPDASLTPVTSIEELQRRFPIHAPEREEILHPGLSQIFNQTRIPSDLSQTMMAPTFFDTEYASVYGASLLSVRQYLGNNGERLITPEEAASIGSFDPLHGLETIYCSIASYRDPECKNTVVDLFMTAEYPDRIRVAIVEQRLSIDDSCNVPEKSCMESPGQMLCKYAHLIDYYSMDARLSVGPVFARHLANRMYRGEYFAMQLDSHVRMTKHWDSDIVEQWKSANNEMAVLSVYASDIDNSIDPVTHKTANSYRPIMCNSRFEPLGKEFWFGHGAQPIGQPDVLGEPTLQPFWAAGFSFARGHLLIQVPYDQHSPMIFQGEEINVGVRAFTFGYDIYAPEREVCFHIYQAGKNLERRKTVPKFIENMGMYEGIEELSLRRLNSIIGMKISDKSNTSASWFQKEKDKYGIGKVRTPKKFYRTFGIHINNHTVERNMCTFVGKRMMHIFKPALRKNRMGLDYDQIDYTYIDEWVPFQMPNLKTDVSVIAYAESSVNEFLSRNDHANLGSAVWSPAVNGWDQRILDRWANHTGRRIDAANFEPGDKNADGPYVVGKYLDHWNAIRSNLTVHTKEKNADLHFVFEDSVSCVPNLRASVMGLVSQLPSDWDLIYLSGHPQSYFRSSARKFDDDSTKDTLRRDICRGYFGKADGPIAPDGSRNLTVDQPYWRTMYSTGLDAYVVNTRRIHRLMGTLDPKAKHLSVDLQLADAMTSGTLKAFMPTMRLCDQRKPSKIFWPEPWPGYFVFVGKDASSHPALEESAYAWQHEVRLDDCLF